MKLILFAAVSLILTFTFAALAADDAKTQTATQTSGQPAESAATQPSDDGDGAAADTGQTDGGQKVAPGRAPTGSSGDFPYSEDEMRQADPGYNNSTKNMPVDQD